MAVKGRSEGLREVAREIVRRGGAAALTGAGISVESGIPDFRSAGGIWERYDPRRYSTLDAFLERPLDMWRFFMDLSSLLTGAKPNPAHQALARLEGDGRVLGIATQNIDGLHQAAGSKVVHELHGSGAALRCARCGQPHGAPRADVEAGVRAGFIPLCEACGGPVKPDVVLFGEELPATTYHLARRLVRKAPVLLVVGTSALVHPAAGLADAAKLEGALVVELNLEETELSDEIADVTVLGRAGDTLPALASAVAEEAARA